jgi:protein involved in polysaccharide export with SLBB domain
METKQHLAYVLTMFRFLCYNLDMKQPTGFRLTPEARVLLDAMSKATGISHTAMLEILIREGAKKRGIRADLRVQAENQQGPTECH